MKSTPTRWDKAKLADIAKVQTGLSKSENRQGESISRPYLRVANVQDGHLDLREIKFIDVPVTQLDRFQLYAGDILLTEGGDFDKLGRGCMWNGEIEHCVHQNHVFAVRVNDPSRIKPAFLALAVQSERSRAYFVSCGKQTTNLASINSSQIKQLPVLLPPIAEQTAIVKLVALTSLQIDTATALLNGLEQRKLGLMQQLLTGRRRLKGFRGKWKSRRMGQLFEEVTRTSNEPLPVMTVSAGRGFLMQADRFNRVMAGKNLEKYTALKEGEFAYNRGNSKTYRCGCIYMLRGHKQAAVPNVYITFKPKVDLCSEFYEFYFEANLLEQQLRRIINSGVRNDGLLNLNTADFFRLQVPAPDPVEQATIAKLLRTSTAEINILKEQLEQLKVQKRALMQKLLSGEWRLPANLRPEKVAA